MNEAYNWLNDTAAEEILKLFYENDVILFVIWTDKLTRRFCTKVFINESSTLFAMTKMLSYLFKRISDIKYNAEDDRINRITLTQSQKSLANKFSFQLKTMNWRPFKVDIDTSTDNYHDFSTGYV